MKEKLRKQIRTGRERERTDLQPYVNDSPPDRPGRWTAKDQLAHVTAWRQVTAAEVEAVRTGGPGPVLSDDDDIENARIYEETHRLPVASVIASAERSWDQLGSALEACSDEVLAKPRIRGGQEPLWQVAPDHAHHLAEHLVYLHTEIGNEAGAEQAAKWAYEIVSSTLADDHGRGGAEYNLGCFYAVRARRRGDAVSVERDGAPARSARLGQTGQRSRADPGKGRSRRRARHRTMRGSFHGCRDIHSAQTHRRLRFRTDAPSLLWRELGPDVRPWLV